MSELLKVSQDQAYEWVKTGHWNKSKFTEWFTAKLEFAKDEGYDMGYLAAELQMEIE